MKDAERDHGSAKTQVFSAAKASMRASDGQAGALSRRPPRWMVHPSPTYPTSAFAVVGQIEKPVRRHRAQREHPLVGWDGVNHARRRSRSLPDGASGVWIDLTHEEIRDFEHRFGLGRVLRLEVLVDGAAVCIPRSLREVPVEE